MKSKKLNTKFQNLKSEHGITLIALIITIVVMLILVAVTLSIALGENGVINSAKEAKEKTNIEIEKEKLLDAVFATVGSSGEVNLEDIVLPEGFTEVSSDDTKVTYQGPSGKQYEVENITGKITEIIETEPKGDGGGEEINPVVGTYYFPGNIEAITLNEDGTGTLMGNNVTYTCIDSALSINMGGETKVFTFIDLGNNIIILDEDVLLAKNRNGLEGEEIDGQYRKDWGPSDDDECLTIDSETGTYVIEYASFGSGLGKQTGYYFYYNNTVYHGTGEGKWTVNESGIEQYVRE